MSTTKTVVHYKDLFVWQKGVRLTIGIYRLTQSFPKDERFGLISQMRRAAVSIPSNIAEGQARNITGEFIQFVSHAEGSLAELDIQLIISTELGFCKDADVKEISGSIMELPKMLNSLHRALNARR